ADVLTWRHAYNWPCGTIQQVVHGSAPVVPSRDDLGRGADQATEERLVAYDLAMVLDVGRGRDHLDQFRQICGSPHRLELALGLQVLREGDLIDDLAVLREDQHG